MNSLIAGATGRMAQTCTKIPAAPATASAPGRATPKSSAHARLPPSLPLRNPAGWDKHADLHS